MTVYQTLPGGPPVPPRDRIAYRDRWQDDDLNRLRALLWWRLQSKAHATDVMTDRVLEEIERVARQYRRDGGKLRRHPEGRSWGIWLQRSAHELRRWTASLRSARRRI